MFANLTGLNSVGVCDRRQHTQLTAWSIAQEAQRNGPLAFDEANHRLFVGCRLPSKLVVLNTQSGDVATSINISGDPDDVFYDSKRHRIYAICGAGKIDIIEQANANSYKTLVKMDTAAGARTGFFVPERDTLLVAVPRRGSHNAEIRTYHIE